MVPGDVRQTAEQKVALLELMLGQVSQYCPIISRNTIIKSSTSLHSIWDLINIHFGFQPANHNEEDSMTIPNAVQQADGYVCEYDVTHEPDMSIPEGHNEGQVLRDRSAMTIHKGDDNQAQILCDPAILAVCTNTQHGEYITSDSVGSSYVEPSVELQSHVPIPQGQDMQPMSKVTVTCDVLNEPEEHKLREHFNQGHIVITNTSAINITSPAVGPAASVAMRNGSPPSHLEPIRDELILIAKFHIQTQDVSSKGTPNQCDEYACENGFTQDLDMAISDKHHQAQILSDPLMTIIPERYLQVQEIIVRDPQIMTSTSQHGGYFASCTTGDSKSHPALDLELQTTHRETPQHSYLTQHSYHGTSKTPPWISALEPTGTKPLPEQLEVYDVG